MVFSVASPLPNRPLFRFGLWPSGPPWVRDCSHLSTSSNRKRITRFLLPALRTICGRSPAAHILEIVAWLSCNRSPSCFCVSKFISSCCLRARPTHPEGLASIVCEGRPLAAAVPTGLMPEHLFEKRLGFSPVRVRHWHLVGSPDLRLVVCDLSNSPAVDVAGARMLARLHQDLAARGVALRVVEAHARARDLLRAEGVEDRVGYLGRHLALDGVIDEHEQSQPGC